MDRQRTFEKVRDHLLRQGKKSTLSTPFSGCLYHGPGGLRCAVGCLIPVELYRPEIEDKPVNSIMRDWPCLAKHIGYDFSSDDPEFLLELQWIHDREPVEEWPARLDQFADYWGLVR